MLKNVLSIKKNEKFMIALVGAGGKTTTMLYLAEYYKKLDMRVLVTTTTRIFVPEKSKYDNFIMNESENIDFKDIRKGTITLLGKGIEKNNKVIGLDIKTIDELYLKSLFDIILVEADGSKHKPIKAPELHEPVIPIECTHVIGVIGLDALGSEVNDENVHRLKAFKRITEAKNGDLINNNMLLSLINHENGLFKNVPKKSKKILLLNKAINSELEEEAKVLKNKLCWNKEIQVVIRGRYND